MKDAYYALEDKNEEVVFFTDDVCEAIIVTGVAIDTWNEVWLAFWRMGISKRTHPIKQRLKWFWAILRYGSPYVDMASMQPDTARRMAHKIIEYADAVDEAKAENKAAKEASNIRHSRTRGVVGNLGWRWLAARRRYATAKEKRGPKDEITIIAWHEMNEAHNAFEVSRRIFYGVDED